MEGALLALVLDDVLTLVREAEGAPSWRRRWLLREAEIRLMRAGLEGERLRALLCELQIAAEAA
jgi:hypothetical protein